MFVPARSCVLQNAYVSRLVARLSGFGAPDVLAHISVAWNEGFLQFCTVCRKEYTKWLTICYFNSLAYFKRSNSANRVLFFSFEAKFYSALVLISVSVLFHIDPALADLPRSHSDKPTLQSDSAFTRALLKSVGNRYQM